MQALVECRHHLLSGGVVRVVLLLYSKIEQAITVQCVRGHLVRDDFLGSWYGLHDGGAHAPEYALHRLGLRGDVLVEDLKSLLAILSRLVAR